MTQGIFVGQRDRKGAVLYITKNGAVRGKSWTRQTLSDAWAATNWDGLCGTPWQMVALVTSVDKNCGGKNSGGLSQEDSTVCLLTSRLMVTQEVVGLCSAGIAWKSDQTTQQRMSRTNQNDH